MPITELALIHLLPGTTATDASLLSTLSSAKQLMETYTNSRFYYLQQIEDPSYIYIHGEWDSLTQHMDSFIPSAENQAVIEALKGKAEVKWLMHLDVPQASLPVMKGTGRETVFSIARHFVKAGQERKFEEAYESNEGYLQDFVTEGDIGGGWRVDREGEKEEWVLVCPWESVGQHYAFGKEEGFGKYMRIKEHLDGAEIKHAKIMEV